MGSIYAMLQIFRYIVYVGPWVKVPKALEEETQMWVYGVSPALGYESQKTQGMTINCERMDKVKQR